MARDFDYYFSQLRRIEDHRSKEAEAEIRKLYKELLKETKRFVAEEYFELAEDGKLTYEILRSHARDARFLEEVEQRLGGISQKVSGEIKTAVSDMYSMAYSGISEAVVKGSPEQVKQMLGGLGGATADMVKAVVDNPVATVALEKNYKDTIYGIRQQIATGLMVGDRYDTMAKRLAKALDISYKKATTIVRTETGRAREAGHLESAKEVNDALKRGTTDIRMTKTWKSMKDGRVRDHHRSMDGILIEADAEFTLPGGQKTQAPRQSGIASEDINCRCYASYKPMTDQMFFKKTGKHFGGEGNSDEKCYAFTDEKPIRPKRRDYDNEDAYDAALSDYRRKKESYDAAYEENIIKNLNREPVFSTVGDVKQWAKNVGVKGFDEMAENIDIRAMNDIKPVVEEMFNKYPFLRGRTIEDRIDGGTFEFEFHLGWLTGEDARGSLMESRGGVFFSADYFTDYRKALEETLDSIAGGFFVRGDGTIRTAIRHEFGHEVFSELKERCYQKNRNYDEAWEDVKALASKSPNGMSEYSQVTYEEFFAEGFAEYSSGRDSELAKGIAKIMKKWLG